MGVAMPKALMKLVFSGLLVVFQSNVYAEEIYQDKDGVWRNRETAGEAAGQMSTSIGEAYMKLWTDGPIQDTMQKSFKEMNRKNDQLVDKLIYENQQKRADNKRKEEELKLHDEAKKRVSNPESFEKFDPSKSAGVKSEWEFFDDPR